MIPKANWYRESVMQFHRSIILWDCICDHFATYIPMTAHRQMVFRQEFMQLCNENLIIPLNFHGKLGLNIDKTGCRIFDWKMLSTPQVKEAMKLCGDFRTIEVCDNPITHIVSTLSETTSLTVPVYEKYSKFLNVTYLVNDEFMTDWCNPHYEDLNIANKNVKECSVQELLFAIKKKLDKQEEK